MRARRTANPTGCFSIWCPCACPCPWPVVSCPLVPDSCSRLRDCRAPPARVSWAVVPPVWGEARMGVLVLLGGAAQQGDPLSRPEVIYGTLGLAVALLFGAGVIYFVDKWRKRAGIVTEADAVDSLTSYREMYEEGEITEAEYAELRRRVADKVK